MTVKAILDTDILSDHGVFTFTSVTVYEIVYGFELKGASSQLKKVMAWLKQNEEITPIDADYFAADTIKATARKQGSVVELADCLIASIAVKL